MDSTMTFSEMPGWLIAVLAVLVTLQLGLQILALIKMLGTPEEQLVFGKKWPWLLIILLGELIGAIVFLAAGRKPAPAIDPMKGQGESRPSDRAERAADVLYGPREGDE